MRLSQSWEKHSVSYHWRVSFVHLFAADYPDMLKTFPFDSSVLRDRCHIFSNTFSSSKKYLHCFFFFFCLSILWIILPDLLVINQSYIPEINPVFFFNYIFQESIHSGLLLLFKISAVFSFSISLISTFIFIIFFLLLTLGLICSFFPSLFLRWNFR